MRRGEVAILLGFAALVGAGALLVGPTLLGSRGRPRAPRQELRPGPAAGAPGLPPAPTGDAGPRLDVRVEGGGAVPAPGAWRVAGADLEGDRLVRRRGRGVLLGAPGFAWSEVGPTGPDGAVRIALRPAASPLSLSVVEADGRPAVGVPVEYGPPAARPPRRTGPDGRFVIDDALPGVLRVHLGGTERDGPTLVLRAGRDVAARAVLEPGFRLVGTVVDDAGAPVAGAELRVLAPEGPAAPEAQSDARGAFDLTARASESLVLEVVAPGFSTARVEPALPDPLGSAPSTTVRVVLAREAGRIAGTLDRRGLQRGDRVSVEVEPAVLAPAVEAFGSESVVAGARRFESPPSADFEVAGWPAEVPARVRVRGDVVPEDHVLRPGDPRARALRLVPERAESDAAPQAAATLPPERLGAVRGRIQDAEGHPLGGLTVAVEGRRTSTAADGTFVLDGLPRGERVEAVYGWLDGSDPGAEDPAAFAPWASGTVTVGGDPMLAVLPAAVGLSARLLEGVTDRPLGWARVLLLDDRAEVALDRCVATLDGRVAFDGLPLVGAGSLVVLAPGLRRELPVAPRAGRRLEVGDVRLARGGRVTGLVRDRRGRPVPGAAVAVLADGRTERAGLGRAHVRDGALRRTRTGADGAFVLDGLDASAPVAVAIAAEGFAPTVRRVLFPDGPDASLTVTLAKGGRMRVGLSDPSGAPLSGATLELVDARSGARHLDVVLRAALFGVVGSSEDLRRAGEALLLEDPGRRGSYRVGPLEPGPYEVFFACPGFRPLRQTLTVPDAEPEDPSSPVRPLPLASLEWQVTLEPEEARPSDGR